MAGALVDSRRVREVKKGKAGKGPVIYWMSRDQRARDNWALIHALEAASGTGAPVAVCFNLVPEFLGAGARHFGFMLRGLREMEGRLKEMGIPFFLLRGDPKETIPKLVTDSGASLLVTDYSPLRLGVEWRAAVADKVKCPVHEVDAHNVIPVWVTSDKKEHAARTIRPKIHGLLPQFLREFPEAPKPTDWPPSAPSPPPISWDPLIKEVLDRGAAVPEVTWCTPGEDAARAALDGPTGFLSPSRIALYETKRNDPGTPQALSGMSPYLHYGQIAPQRCALEATKYKKERKSAAAAVDGFLEELVVRRELSDNFCHYEKRYDSLDAAAAWAQETLRVHTADKREHLYSREQLDRAETYDDLWNASQLELVHIGKMHGFMRMYWCKKILEWSATPAEALATAIYLNDRYSLDGRDPNGYVGCMWSICGIHDMGWTERAIFGKIRYMNYAGCKRKFDIQAYVSRIRREVVKITGVSPPGLGAAAAPAAAAGGKRKAPAAAAAASAAAAANAAGAAAAAAKKPKVVKPVVPVKDADDL